jgi:Uma2 family endonuclease
MTVDLKHLTYQQYLDLPEMRARYSIVDGELVMAAAPTTEHQRTILELAVKLTPLFVDIRSDKCGLPPSTLSSDATLSAPDSPISCTSAMPAAISLGHRLLREVRTW